MSSRRVLKVAEAIREVVALAILTELRDPRIADVTVTFVEVARDLRAGKIHVSVMGDETKQQRCVNALQNAAGFLQQKVANRVDLRYTPKLRFVLDQGVKNAFAVTRILEEVLPKERMERDGEGATVNEDGDSDSEPTEADTAPETVDSDGVSHIAKNSLPEADAAE